MYYLSYFKIVLQYKIEKITKSNNKSYYEPYAQTLAEGAKDLQHSQENCSVCNQFQQSPDHNRAEDNPPFVQPSTSRESGPLFNEDQQFNFHDEESPPHISRASSTASLPTPAKFSEVTTTPSRLSCNE